MCVCAPGQILLRSVAGTWPWAQTGRNLLLFLCQEAGDISCSFSFEQQQTVCFKHEKSNQEEDLDCAVLWQGREREEEGTVAKDVDCWDPKESEAEGQRCRNKDGEVDERATLSANTRPEEDEDILGPVNSFYDNFALDELIQARSDDDE